jgi:hypothetical protein
MMVIFWDVMPRALVRTYVLEEHIISIIKVQLLVTANVVSSSVIHFTLKMEAIHSSET